MTKSLRRFIAVATAIAAVLTMTAAGPSEAQVPKVKINGKFHIQGLNVVNPKGNVVTLRGVSKNGLEYTSTGYDEALWNYKLMKSWGANVVRIPLATNFMMKGMCTYDPNYLRIVDRIVGWGHQLKMLILLDSHFTTQGRTCGQRGWSTNQEMPDRLSLEMMKMLAKRYKDMPYVALDLHNEPHNISWDVWRNGGIVNGWRAVGMQQMLDAVRAQGFTGLVVASGAQWGNDMRMIATAPLARDQNVIYGAHVYPYWCFDKVWDFNRPYVCNGRRYNPTYDNLVQPLVGRRPVMITEFSTPRNEDAEMREPIQWAEDRKLGWIAWDWCRGEAKHYCLLKNDGTNQPSVIGKPVWDYLARNGR